MKVLQVVPYFYPAWSYGGIPRVSYHLSVSLARIGVEVEVVTTDAQDENKRRNELNFIINGIPVRAYRNLSNHLAYHLQLFLPLGFRSEKYKVSNYDLIHIHGHRNILNTLFSSWANKAGIPVILEPGGTVVNIERRKGFKSLFDLIMGNRQIKKTNLFIAVSEAEKRQFLGRGIPQKKIKVVPNGILIENPRSEVDFKKRLRINGDYILYLGKFTPRKGIEYIIEALSLIPNKNLYAVIAGNDMGVKSNLEKLAYKLGLSDRVLFPGLLDSPLKEAAYKEALITIYAGKYEIFGLVPFESMLCGTPVIVANDSGCGEWVAKSGGGYLVPFGNPQAIADVILQLDQTIEKENIKKAQKWIMGNLSWEQIAQRMLGIYEERIDIKANRNNSPQRE